MASPFSSLSLNNKTDHSAGDPPLKCPRCGSFNTKFCYYNNYSLSQPRHLCKACKRYWTRGGSLRNGKNQKLKRRSCRSGQPAANPTCQHLVDPSAAVPICANNHLFSGLHNFPIDQTRVSGMYDPGLGFSAFDDLDPIESLVSSSSAYDSISLFPSTSFALNTRSMESLEVSSLKETQPAKGFHPDSILQPDHKERSDSNTTLMEQFISFVLPWSTPSNSQHNTLENIGSSDSVPSDLIINQHFPFSSVSHWSEV